MIFYFHEGRQHNIDDVCVEFCFILELIYSSYKSTLSWRDRKTDKVGIHLTENGSNQRHVIFDGR